MPDSDTLVDEPFHFVATKFLAKAGDLESHALQLLMAKASGQFKFGNERHESDR